MERVTALALLGLVAVGCTPTPMLMMSEHAVMPDYSRALIEELRGRPIKVEVRGDPFRQPAEAFAGQIAATMTTVSDARALAFSSRDIADMAAGYKVVWDFAPRRGRAPDEICAAAQPTGASQRLPVDAQAALCRGDRALTAVRARLYYTDTQNSLEFIALVDDAVRALFPERVPPVRRDGAARLAPWAPHVAR